MYYTYCYVKLEGALSMNKKLLMLLISMFAAVMIMTGCGSNNNDNNNNNDTEENNNENNENDEDENENNDAMNNNNNEDDNDNAMNNNESENDDDEASMAIADSDFAQLIEHMEEETEGTARIIYETDQTQEHDSEGITTTLDGYTLVELTDFHANFSIPFNDQTDGGVVIAKYTVKNDTDDDVYYMPTLDLSYVGATQVFSNYRELLPEDEQLTHKLAPSNDYLLEAGEAVTGYYTYPLGEDILQDVLAEGTADVEVPQPFAEKEDYSSHLGEEGTFTISLDADSADNSNEKASEGFYEDRVTAENMGEKEMIDSQENIGESDDLGDFTVTLDGYQFTAFEPNADEAPRFESYDTGIVLLTIKFNIDNQSSSEIGMNSVTSKLTMNDGSYYTLNEGMLLGYKNDDTIDPGERGDILQVYPLDKEQYDKIWKDKSFEVEIGPMKDAEAQDISKGKKASFNLK